MMRDLIIYSEDGERLFRITGIDISAPKASLRRRHLCNESGISKVSKRTNNLTTQARPFTYQEVRNTEKLAYSYVTISCTAVHYSLHRLSSES
jgi:hypothetical protein